MNAAILASRGSIRKHCHLCSIRFILNFTNMAGKNMLVLQYLSLGYHELKDKIVLKCVS